MIALINPWGWAVLAAVLAGAEIVAPGVFLIWLAAAAASTAAVTALVAIDWEVQLALFAVLSVIAVLAGRLLVGEPVSKSAPGLNRRAERMLGTTVIVTEALHNGSGRVQLGDSTWTAEGPDLPVGAHARIVAVEGVTLHIEPA